jgi:hypothetical protein
VGAAAAEDEVSKVTGLLGGGAALAMAAGGTEVSKTTGALGVGVRLELVLGAAVDGAVDEVVGVMLGVPGGVVLEAAGLVLSFISSSALTSRSNCSLSWRAIARALPIQLPTCLATFGNRSGPSTIRAMAEVSSISEHATSNAGFRRHLGFSLAGSGRGRRSGGGVEVRVMLQLLGLLFGLTFVHGRFEAFHGRTQVGSDAAQALGAEDDQSDQQNDYEHF